MSVDPAPSAPYTGTGRRLSPPTILVGPTIPVGPTARGIANSVEVIVVEVIAPIRTAIAEFRQLLGKPMGRYVRVAALPRRRRSSPVKVTSVERGPISRDGTDCQLRPPSRSRRFGQKSRHCHSSPFPIGTPADTARRTRHSNSASTGPITTHRLGASCRPNRPSSASATSSTARITPATSVMRTPGQPEPANPTGLPGAHRLPRRLVSIHDNTIVLVTKSPYPSRANYGGHCPVANGANAP